MTPDLSRETTWLIRLGLSAVIVGAVFLILPQIDLWVAGWFYDPDIQKFPLARAPVPLFLNDLIEWIAMGLAVFSLIGLGYTLIRQQSLFHLGATAYSFLALSLITGPGLIANALFKENWGRARPRQITEFGGTQEFSPPLLIADQCPSNCSFVSGDASMGFAVLAVAVLIPFARPVWIALAVGFGVLMGITRIVQGAHFFSDVIYAGIFVSAAIIVLKMIVLDGAWGIGARTSAWLGARLAGPARRLGLRHDSDALAWRAQAFAPYEAADWKGRTRLFFRARPSDFDLPDAGDTGT